MALGTELTESQNNICFFYRTQMLGDGDLQDLGTGSLPPAGFVGEAWMASRHGRRNLHGTAGRPPRTMTMGPHERESELTDES